MPTHTTLPHSPPDALCIPPLALPLKTPPVAPDRPGGLGLGTHPPEGMHSSGWGRPIPRSEFLAQCGLRPSCRTFTCRRGRVCCQVVANMSPGVHSASEILVHFSQLPPCKKELSGKTWRKVCHALLGLPITTHPSLENSACELPSGSQRCRGSPLRYHVSPKIFEFRGAPQIEAARPEKALATKLALWPGRAKRQKQNFGRGSESPRSGRLRKDPARPGLSVGGHFLENPITSPRWHSLLFTTLMVFLELKKKKKEPRARSARANGKKHVFSQPPCFA